MRVLFCTNLPSPYRVDFFNELGKYCELTVCYERKISSERDAKWVGKGAQTYREVYLDLKPVGVDRSRGSALRKYLSTNQFDRIIMTNYISLSCMEAIIYCKLKKIPYCIEYDGGFNKADSTPKWMLKHFLLGSAVGHFTTCDEHIEYLKGLGIKSERIYKYPFTSLTESDVERANRFSTEEKEDVRRLLQMYETHIILSVGRFSYEGGYGKGYDTLMLVAESLSKSIGIYIVGDEPTQEFLNWQKIKNLYNVHFVGFKEKNELSYYYAAADAFILLSKKDVWGLVINEAMSFGLPVITTKQCLAGTELVKDGINGYLIDSNDAEAALQSISKLFSSEERIKQFGKASRNIIGRYTIENMAKRHLEILT